MFKLIHAIVFRGDGWWVCEHQECGKTFLTLFEAIGHVVRNQFRVAPEKN